MAKLTYNFDTKNHWKKYNSYSYVLNSPAHKDALYKKIEKNGMTKVIGTHVDWTEETLTLVLPLQGVRYLGGTFTITWDLVAPSSATSIPKQIELVNSKTGGYDTYTINDKKIKNLVVPYESDTNSGTRIELLIW